MDTFWNPRGVQGAHQAAFQPGAASQQLPNAGSQYTDLGPRIGAGVGQRGMTVQRRLEQTQQMGPPGYNTRMDQVR